MREHPKIAAREGVRVERDAEVEVTPARHVELASEENARRRVTERATHGGARAVRSDQPLVVYAPALTADRALGKVDAAHGRVSADFCAGRRRPLGLIASEALARQRDDLPMLWIEPYGGLAAKRGSCDERQAGIGWETEGAQLADGLRRQTAAASFRTDARVSLEHEHVAPGCGEHLRCPQTGGSGADDDVIPRFHRSTWHPARSPTSRLQTTSQFLPSKSKRNCSSHSSGPVLGRRCRKRPSLLTSLSRKRSAALSTAWLIVAARCVTANGRSPSARASMEHLMSSSPPL
jgi:hypothetical protein